MHRTFGLYIGEGKISEVNKILSELHCSSPLVVSGNHTWAVCGQNVFNELNSGRYYLVLDNGIGEVEKVRQLIVENNVDIICATGGGKVIDVCKYAAYLEGNVDVISIPTAPSHDGICSPIAVIKLQNKFSRSLKAKMPIAAICDTNVLRDAPEDLIQSGIGDLISTLSALEDWELAYKAGFEKECNGLAALIAKHSARFFLETMKNNSTHSKKLIQRLTEGLVLSGLAMEIAGSSSPCSGAEHLFSHALDELYGSIASHGKQVAVGTVLATCLRGKDWKEYVEFFESFSIPTNYEKLGATEEQIINALIYAPKTRPGRYTIFDKVKLDATRAKEVAKRAGVI